jgi:hypothetical protein
MKIKTTSLKPAESKSQTSQQTLADQEGAMCRTTGTHNIETAVRIVTQVRAAQVWPEPETEDRIQSFAGAFASIGEMAPQNATEAMLATQMIAAHEASLKFLHLSTLEGQHSEYIDANLLRATRLMRLFSQQAETMQKLKGKAAPPNLIVGHVDVHHGGQAILGSATVSKGEAQ